ncbi:YeeE/YedE thiosulfate transporter family protein [Streptomyces europaeiscabiei]|uniref:YeeE/YedE family protein n=1 Tax=Streptomyces europaeiscabiei TaxID=146819 RepID=UPI00299FECE6|nr:YeeE/YedE thiosulfate transporter family protein [Streptomyces europaeiscabiei]MDX3690159.1 YeeE/YedE thiosulfate transporter family protein [Streptomyces europaeiscabiei]
MSTYWPWWAGALGLAALTVGYTLATDRSFGVSGAWDRVLHWRRERELERTEEEFADERALTAALVKASADHFATLPAEPPLRHQSHGEPSSGPPVEPSAASTSAASTSAVTRQRPAPLATQAALLISIFLGGLIASLASGRFHLRLDMGPGFRNLVTADPVAMVVLLFTGGVLVGFGTRLAGGCSSGHGLNGCGRRDPVSIVATATFFGTAVAVSFLLWKVI